jgi:hypothetical protein
MYLAPEPVNRHPGDNRAPFVGLFRGEFVRWLRALRDAVQNAQFCR